MRRDGRGRAAQVITLAIILLTILLVNPAHSDYPGNYICIGNCIPVVPSQSGNQPPVFENIADQTVAENSVLTFAVNASDPENDIAYVSAYLPPGSYLDQSGMNFTFRWTPDYSQAGQHYANFTVADSDGLIDVQNVSIMVTNTNRPPELNPIGDKLISEGEYLSFGIYSSDPDGEPLIVSHSTLPDGATVDPDGLGNYSFRWTPCYGQYSIYYVNFSVTDPYGNTDYENVGITVLYANRPPQLDLIGGKSIAEGALLTFGVRAIDPDQDEIKFAVLDSPFYASFDPDGFGNYTFSWTPDYEKSGMYYLNFTASDGSLLDYEIVPIQVTNTNRPPSLNDIGNKLGMEGTALNFTLNATDPDGDSLTFAVSPLPSGATFMGRGFLWTPDFDQMGTYVLNCTVTDSGGLVDYELITITVTNINRPPVLDPIVNKTVSERMNLNFSVIASDPDRNSLTISSNNLPVGAQLQPNPVGDYTFNWTPSYNQHGTYLINFTVTDGQLEDHATVNVTVTDVQVPPQIEPIENKTIQEGLTLNFTVNASDPDGTPIIYSVASLPYHASFNTTTGAFMWIPTYDQSGIFYLNFSVTDENGYVVYQNVTVTVIPPKLIQGVSVNYAPVFTNLGNQTGYETYPITFSIQANDFDTSNLVYSAASIPSGAYFNPATQKFTWTSEYASSGTYTAKFSVTDGSITDYLDVVINILKQPLPSRDCSAV